MASPTAVVLIFAVLLCGVIECITYRDQCIDLDGLAGRCVKLSKCHSMGDIWRTPVKSIRQSERLADSLCGRYSKNPLVSSCAVLFDVQWFIIFIRSRFAVLKVERAKLM